MSLVCRKSVIGSIVITFLAAVSSPSYCASGFVKGQVEFIRTHDGTQFPWWSPPTFWFSLKGVSQAGTCPRWGAGNSVLFVMSDKQALSIVLTAQASGQEIAVAFDDSKLTNSWCSPNYITVGNPAPLY